jgi:16S rRNA (uracil1498-N3)-methyltransferase
VKPPLRVPVEGLAEGTCDLPPEAAAYATRVHRLGLGDSLVLFDPDAATEADASIEAAGKHRVTVRVATVRAARHVPTREVTLLQGVSKGDKLDAIVRDATELGATRLVPVLCERSVARPDAARARRWRKVAVEAARQCGRGDAPSISAPMSFADAISEASKTALRVCLDPAAPRSLAAAWSALGAQPVVLAVGPEGGFTDAEIALAESAGFVRASLGPLVLRTETVCAAVLGALLARSLPHERPD